MPHPSYPERVHVPDDKVTWDVPWADYTPRPYTAPKVGENWETHNGVGAKGWADPPTPLGGSKLGNGLWRLGVALKCQRLV